MTYTDIAMLATALALFAGGCWCIHKAQTLSKKAPDGPLIAPDVVTDNIVQSCGCVFCDLDMSPEMTSLGMYHTHQVNGAPHLTRCTRDWLHRCL